MTIRSGHSYNSGRLILGALPFRGGTLVFYRQLSSTDQVAGLVWKVFGYCRNHGLPVTR